MFVEMSCNCGATLQVDSLENETIGLVWGQRFVNAHQDCGFVSKVKEEVEEKTKRYDITHKEQRKNEL
jgi:hypothetical protein